MIFFLLPINVFLSDLNISGIDNIINPTTHPISILDRNFNSLILFILFPLIKLFKSFTKES